MEFKSTKTGQKRILFDADGEQGKRIAEKIAPPEDEQEPTESRRQWREVTDAILAKDMDAATDAKCAVEDAQREDRKVRDEKGEEFVPMFFVKRDGRWVPKIEWVLIDLSGWRDFTDWVIATECPLTRKKQRE